MKNLNLIVKICAVVFTSLFAIAETGGIIAEENANLINQVLKEKTYEIIQNDNNENTDYLKQIMIQSFLYVWILKLKQKK